MSFTSSSRSTTEIIHLTTLELTDSSETQLSESEPEQEDDYFPDGGFRAYSVVFGSFLGLVTNFGIIDSMGVIQTYIATHQLVNVKTSTVSWIFSIYLALSMANCVIVGPFFDVKGATWLLVVGTIMMFGGFMAVATSTTVWQFILSLSICVGIGNSLNITPLIGVLSHWFNLKRGTAIGLATMGGSIGGIIVPIMLKNLYPKFGFAWSIRILGFFCLGCMLFSIFLCRERITRKSTSSEEIQRGNGKFQTMIAEMKEYFEFKALLDPKYSFCIAGTFAVELAFLSMMTYLASYAITQGMSESDSYILITVFNSTGVLGRLVPGYLSDKLGYFNIMILMLFGFTLSMLVLWLPFGHSIPVLYAFASISGFFSCSILSLTPVCLSTITPVRKFGARYGLLYLFVSMGNLFGIPLSGAIIGEGSKHQYNMFALYCSMFAVMGTIGWIISRYCIVGMKLNVKI
ncbi:putative transporter MCH4 [Spathaspora sp. JA1]|nr:putative transporter MCH4 [Spathaspora sp. JA1]